MVGRVGTRARREEKKRCRASAEPFLIGRKPKNVCFVMCIVEVVRIYCDIVFKRLTLKSNCNRFYF